MIIQEMKIRTIIMKTWVVNVEEDENGDAYIQLPDEVLQHANLKEGDTVVWTDNEDGSWSLQKKVDDERK
jgi:bifunctional DNA-binding transcriptional regulator/antitoxin component of YhaV-PrlF toxin-antitoxin module